MIRIPSAAARLSLAAIAATALLTGCGWTARDQYLERQSATVRAHQGDGSYLASDWRSGPGRPLHSTEVAQRFEGPN